MKRFSLLIIALLIISLSLTLFSCSEKDGPESISDTDTGIESGEIEGEEHLSPDTEFLYWIENFLISRLRALRFAEIEDRLDAGEDMTYDAIVAELSNNQIK